MLGWGFKLRREVYFQNMINRVEIETYFARPIMAGVAPICIPTITTIYYNFGKSMVYVLKDIPTRMFRVR